MTCMRGEGIRVERSDEPGRPWRLDLGGLDDATFQAISSSCRRKVGPFPEIVPTTREELSALYDLNLEAKECLEARGVTVSDPPSREQWIEDNLRVPGPGEPGPWSPFNSLAAHPHIEACPEPDVYDVYGIDLYDVE